MTGVKNYFRFFHYSSARFENEESQFAIFGRKLCVGDVVQTAEGFVLQGKTKLHRLDGLSLRIPLNVSSEFENVLDELSHLLDAQVSFTIECRPTDKSVMTKLGVYPNCYWKDVWIEFNHGLLYDFYIRFFDTNIGCWKLTHRESVDDYFDRCCEQWSSMLVVIDGVPPFYFTGRTSEKTTLGRAHQLKLFDCELELNGDEKVEVHFGPTRDIAEIRNRIEGFQKPYTLKHIELLENGEKFKHASTFCAIRIIAEGTVNEQRERITVQEVLREKHTVYQHQEKYFHRVILDVCIALASFNIANYEMREIICTLPGMRHQENSRMMKIIFAVNESIRKIYQERENKNKLSRI